MAPLGGIFLGDQTQDRSRVCFSCILGQHLASLDITDSFLDMAPFCVLDLLYYIQYDDPLMFKLLCSYSWVVHSTWLHQLLYVSYCYSSELDKVCHF
jgi:hypothetical protein